MAETAVDYVAEVISKRFAVSNYPSSVLSEPVVFETLVTSENNNIIVTYKCFIMMNSPELSKTISINVFNTFQRLSLDRCLEIAYFKVFFLF